MTQRTQRTQPTHPSPHTLEPEAGKDPDLRSTVVLGSASAWSALMLIMSVLWGSSTLDAPFGDPLPGQFTSVLDHLPVPLGAGLIGVCALLSLVIAAVLLTAPRLRRTRTVGLFALGLTVLTTVVFTDTLLLAYLGYTLSLQFPPIPVEAVWQGVMLLGVGLWISAWASLEGEARAARRRGRHTDGSRAEDSRAERSRADGSRADGSRPGGIDPGSAGDGRPVPLDAKVAVALAMVVPLFYASTRILWAMGIPIGLSAEFYAKGLEIGLWRSGLALALAGVVGALLTLGLVQRWGERLPRWTGPLAGRRVPILLATVPAAIISLAIFTGGMGMARDVLVGGPGIPGTWTTYGPVLLFPLWGAALGWATYRYRARRLGD